jgi:L-threonylcarbamoyladenylate synthase
MLDPLGGAVAVLAGGGLVAFPTETVWGLGADARSAAGVDALFRFKGRAQRQPVSVLVASSDALARCGFAPDAAAQALAKRFWPGPLTLVMPHPGGFAAGIARESDGAVGVRCSSHPLAAALARRLDRAGVGPMTATSLNPSGAPAARTRAEARMICSRGEPAAPRPQLLDVAGAECGGDRESTVLDVATRPAVVLRWGAVERDELLPILKEQGLA